MKKLVDLTVKYENDLKKLNDMKKGELKEVPEIFLKKNFKSHFQL